MMASLNRSAVLPAIMICLSCFILSWGCSTSPAHSPVVPDSEETRMLTFQSNEELLEYMKEQYATTVLPHEAYSFSSPIATSVDGDTGAPMAMGGEGAYSQTNLQEAGVDESDQVKTDGNYLYVAGQQQVNIVRAVPSHEMTVVSSVDVRGVIDSLYLYDSILVVLYSPTGKEGTAWGGTNLVGAAEIGMPYWIPVRAQTGILFVDVADPNTPETIREIVVDGARVSTRLTGGHLYVVQQFLPDLPPLLLRNNGGPAELGALIAENRRRLQPVTVDELLPSYQFLDEQGQPGQKQQLVEARDFYRPWRPGGGSIATLLRLNLNDLSQPVQSMGIVADAHLIYASTRAIYLTATRWTCDSRGFEHGGNPFQTVIHKLDITGDTIRCLKSKEVKGKVLNQFSLSEFNDVLRIATTTGDIWGGASSNNLFCLKAEGDALEVIGRLEGLAPGERIYSARFVGTRGYLVTFVKVDPLFTLDLSDPRAPKMIGELKVPGYSDYIHPLGENHLLTIGKHTEEQGGIAWYQGVQLSIFDVSVFDKPVLLHKELIGDRGTESEALHNHKAFTYWAANNLLAFPVDLREHEDEPAHASAYGTHTFTGLYIYRVTPGDGFESLGRISTGGQLLPYYWHYGWTRGVFINSNVYAVQSDAVHSAEWEDITAGGWTLSLPGS